MVSSLTTVEGGTQMQHNEYFIAHTVVTEPLTTLVQVGNKALLKSSSISGPELYSGL